jgi:hypothetical protein
MIEGKFPALAAAVALALAGRVGAVGVLRMGFAVIDIALGIMVPLLERPLPAQHLADDVAARLGDGPDFRQNQSIRTTRCRAVRDC